MPLPSGTVTFLFTDIEGSTTLWEEHPQEMRAALARHDALLRQAIENNSGTVFKTVGDAFCAAFATAPDALSAALAAQCALCAQPWPEALALRVRMALHTGAAELRDNDYFGQPLNRMARLLGAGHGGQTLLSDVAHDLTRDTLPASVSLLSLGEHRLRDLGRPEPVFQLLHPALPDTFPPLKSLDNPEMPNNLPRQVTSFIGREKEIEAVKALLNKTRLLTLTGSGGCGKTRLGLQVAADVLENYPDGAWLVELAALADPALVPQAAASALGLREEPGKPLSQTLVEFLKARRLLLILDNCEHVLEVCSRLADTLIRSCPHVTVLASSREGLGIAGELTYRIPSLSLPDLKQPATVESVSQYEATQLFIERALFHLPTFSVTNQNAPALASLCHRLDGIPLALELASARIRSLSVEEINSKLDNRFRLLTGGSRMALPRQQTLRALIDWSFALLTAQEKTLLCRLSVFAGGWSLEAAEVVGAGEDSETGERIEDWEMLDLLSSLADKSLIVTEQEQEQTRYRLLETVRQYAGDRLEESGECLAVRARHGDYFLTLAEESKLKLGGSEQAQWLEVLEEEHDNLRQALIWYAEDVGDAEAGEKGLRLGAALQRFWWTHGHLSEGQERMSAVLAHPNGQERTQARASALHGAGSLAYYQGDHVASRVLLEESLAIKRELGNASGIATSLHSLGNVAWLQGNYAAARSLYEESLAAQRTLGDKSGIALCLVNLGAVAAEQGDYDRAQVLLEESLTIQRTLGDKGNIAHSLNNLGVVAAEQGDYGKARVLLEESLTTSRELGDKSGIAISLSSLGGVAMKQGDYAAAQVLSRESLTIQRELGAKVPIAFSLEAFASVALHGTEDERCVRLWGAAAALRESIDSPLPPIGRGKQEHEMTVARERLGEAAFALVWAQGRAMTLEQAVAYALET